MLIESLFIHEDNSFILDKTIKMENMFNTILAEKDSIITKKEEELKTKNAIITENEEKK